MHTTLGKSTTSNGWGILLASGSRAVCISVYCYWLANGNNGLFSQMWSVVLIFFTEWHDCGHHTFVSWSFVAHLYCNGTPT